MCFMADLDAQLPTAGTHGPYSYHVLPEGETLSFHVWCSRSPVVVCHHDQIVAVFTGRTPTAHANMFMTALAESHSGGVQEES